MSTWFTSDLHFGHRNIARYSGRPFPDTDDGVVEMGEWMVQAWNDTVQPWDEVVVVGDVAMGRIDDSLAHVARLNGVKHLVSGNHDRCWSGAYPNPDKVATWNRRYREAGFVSITDAGRFDFSTNTYHPVNDPTWGVLVCHFPYTGESQDREDRYVAHRPVDDGDWLIHGHVHEAWCQRGRQINVGVDAWGGRIVGSEEIHQMIQGGPAALPRETWAC